jgi:hypothetical protein
MADKEWRRNALGVITIVPIALLAVALFLPHTALGNSQSPLQNATRSNRTVSSESQSALDGTWQGTLGIVSGQGLSETGKPLPVRIVIANGSARVFVGPDYTLEVKPHQFKFVGLLTNAVIFATDSGHDTEGSWVETWAFAVTLKDSNTLMANYYRVVNNLNLPVANEHGRFSMGYSGELKRL